MGGRQSDPASGRYPASVRDAATSLRILRAPPAQREGARWRGSADIRASFSRASVLTQSRVVYRLKGNRYRLVALVRFASGSSPGIVDVLWIGTHAEYDKIDAHTVRGRRVQEPDHEHSPDPVRR